MNIFILLFPSCTPHKDDVHNKHTFFIQAQVDEKIIKKIQEKLIEKTDNIIQEELGIKQDKNFPIFFPKKRQAVTVYYVKDLYDNNEPLGGLLYLFLEPVIDVFKNRVAPRNASLTSQVDFFGESKPKSLFATVDLIAKIDDLDKELSSLNQHAKSAMRETNENYKRAYNINLYDIAASEKYPYLPHISLGHLRENYILYLINDAAKAPAILARIKQRILDAASALLSELSPEEKQLSFDKIALYDAQKRKYIKEERFD